VSSIFRSFRLLRILKLAKSIQSLRVLLATVAESVGNVAYLTLLLFLFIFIFAVFGMQGACPLKTGCFAFPFSTWVVFHEWCGGVGRRRVMSSTPFRTARASPALSLTLMPPRPTPRSTAVFAGAFTKGRGMTIDDMSYHFGEA
jgi:hypothetical protein